MSNPLGPPITGGVGGSEGTAPRGGFDSGEHGAGTGLSGGYGQVTSKNSQQGMAAAEQGSGFNAGLGGEHASGGLPGQSHHPIADKYMSQPGQTYASSGLGSGTTGSKLDNSLDNFSGQTGSTGLSSQSGYSDQAVSGAYEGGEARDAVSGQSRAFETSPGVGYGGENVPFKDTGASGDRLAGSTKAALAGAGVAGAGGAGAAYLDSRGNQGAGIGPQGGAGGHYDAPQAGGAQSGVLETIGGERRTGPTDVAATAGATAAGGGAYGATQGNNSGSTGTGTGNTDLSNAKYGTVDDDPSRGQPVSNPDDLDSGGRHSLVFDEATGKYKHRHEL